MSTEAEGDVAGIAGKLWATFLPAEAPPADGSQPRGITVAMRDLQTCAVYDTQGQFVGIRRPGSGKPITVRPGHTLDSIA